MICIIKSGKVENWQTTQGLALLCFFIKTSYFLCRFFSINLKLLPSVFLISDQFSQITDRYFHHCDSIITLALRTGGGRPCKKRTKATRGKGCLSGQNVRILKDFDDA